MNRVSLAIAIGVGLGIGIGGGSIAAVRGAPAAIPADSTGAHAQQDSLPIDTLAEQPHMAAGSEVAALPDEDVGMTAVERPPMSGAAAAPEPIAAIVDGATVVTRTDSTAQRLTQIFGAMEPEAAADVLQQLEDATVERVLLGMSDRRAAAILASFPAERAAALTAAMLRQGR